MPPRCAASVLLVATLAGRPSIADRTYQATDGQSWASQPTLGFHDAKLYLLKTRSRDSLSHSSS